MAATGPGEIKSITFDQGGTPVTVTAPYLEAFSLENEPGAFDASNGVNVERGSLRKMGSVRVLDYSAYASLNTLMTARSDHTIRHTYVDSATQDIAECRIRVKPLINQVPDLCQAVLGTTAADATLLDAVSTGWTNLGAILDPASIEFAFAFDGNTGCGKPYFSSVRIDIELLLPLTAAYAAISQGAEAKLAIKTPDGNWMIFGTATDPMYTFKHYSNEDGSQPRVARVRFQAVADDWDDLLAFHDGSAGANVPGDWFAGCEVEYVGHDYAESDMVTWS